MFLSLSLLLLVFKTTLAFDIDSERNLALYWGQNSINTLTNSSTNEMNLTYYCENADANIILLSFLDHFPGTNNVPTLTFNGYQYSYQYQHELTSLASQIETCQSNDKLVMLSLGGEGTSNYGFDTGSQGTEFGEVLWNMFGPKSESTNSSLIRPFGDDVLIDGFDLDAETANDTGYSELINYLGKKINSTSTKNYYLSVAPQCPYPDEALSHVLNNTYIDFAFIQFYNNEQNCDASTENFNWESWANYVNNTAQNKNMKLFLGLPGSSTAASSGYIKSTSVLSDKISQAAGNGSFGGVMIWDASTAVLNNADDDDGDYLNIVQDAFNEVFGKTTSSSSSGNKGSSSSSTSSAAGIQDYGSVSFSIFSSLVFAALSFF